MLKVPATPTEPVKTTSRKRGGGATPDWSDQAEAGAHLWSPSSTSEECFLPDSQCTKKGGRQKCSVCRMTVHTDCAVAATTEMGWLCRRTFREVEVRSYRDESRTEHHWAPQRCAKGKCNSCFKGLQSKKLFCSKELTVVTCSWCKTSYHNREACFNPDKIDSSCSLGVHANIIVPPTWILKLQNIGEFKSSVRLKKKIETEKVQTSEGTKAFVIKPIPSASASPVIVFINPKSGGNQGVKLLQKFQWLLNPRQVFDLTQGGPNMGLELFKRTPQLRVLACGGDGTVGWVLSVIDKLGFAPPPAVGVLPLGTGNDLARALGWGGGYTDEPIDKILTNIGKSEVIFLDRWKLTVEKNPNGGEDCTGNDDLPLNVVNNYFSLGVDAHIALEFHQAREAHPEKFNSRLRNKMFYGQRGGKDLLRRKWKALSDYVMLSCDGTDYTPVLKEHKFHAIVFLNIPSYGGGTHPWPKASEQSTEDGLIEVVGLTTFQLPLLQAGGHGDKICQCKTARIETTKTIPMQVDGEACKLNPSIINLELLNKAAMLAKRKSGRRASSTPGFTSLKFNVTLLKMIDYEVFHHDKSQLKEKAKLVGELTVSPDTDLEQIRGKVNDMLSGNQIDITQDWCFIDSCTADKFFRIDRAQEHLHYVTDIANDDIFILEPPVDVTEVETAFPSPSSDNNKYFSENGKWSKDEGEDTEYQQQSVQVLRRKMEGPLSSNLLSRNLTATTGFRVISRDSLGKSSTKVVEAAKQGDLEKLKELHGEGYSLLSKNSNGETAMHLAAFYGRKEVMKYLITAAPHNIINTPDDKEGHTPLHKAVITKHKNICCMLVAAGAPLNAKDNKGKTPIDLATDNDIESYLLSQKEFFDLEGHKSDSD